ncbi:hypothetical protein Taro_039134 [Colocasia esculenta]|uniref:Uncharacterized protein n=1 Tax=Colocasia esculenta TaxID=4460 RepID=A0A843WEV5_COLES|nr:hypothetical protein [Colocasia esculenta]
MRRVLNATALVVAFLLPSLNVDVCMHAKCHALGGASALVTLMEHIAHNVGMVLRPETLKVSGMDLQLCVCRFDSFEVCPGVGTIVIAVVVCGVPEWWHSFGYSLYMHLVWVMWCDLPLNVLYPSSGKLDDDPTHTNENGLE